MPNDISFDAVGPSPYKIYNADTTPTAEPDFFRKITEYYAGTSNPPMYYGAGANPPVAEQAQALGCNNIPQARPPNPLMWNPSRSDIYYLRADFIREMIKAGVPVGNIAINLQAYEAALLGTDFQPRMDGDEGW